MQQVREYLPPDGSKHRLLDTGIAVCCSCTKLLVSESVTTKFLREVFLKYSCLIDETLYWKLWKASVCGERDLGRSGLDPSAVRCYRTLQCVESERSRRLRAQNNTTMPVLMSQTAVVSLTARLFIRSGRKTKKGLCTCNRSTGHLRPHKLQLIYSCEPGNQTDSEHWGNHFVERYFLCLLSPVQVISEPYTIIRLSGLRWPIRLNSCLLNFDARSFRCDDTNDSWKSFLRLTLCPTQVVRETWK